MSFKNTIIGSIAMIAIGFAAWSTFYYTPPAPSLKKTASLPDAFMENIKSTVMDKQGKPSMILVTPKMVHYTEDDTTDIITPELILYRKSPKPWYVTAKHAKATKGIENVDFWEDVTIHHAADETTPATVIKTNTLTVHPNKQTAETIDLITLVQPTLVVKAVGLFADLKSGDVKLLSQARGEYVPSS